MTKEITLSVGQQVYLKLNNTRELLPATITKVGRLWTTLETGASYKSLYRAPNGSRELEGNGYGHSSQGTIYLSELEYANQQATECAWLDFRQIVSRHSGCPDLTAEQITTMHEIIEKATK